MKKFRVLLTYVFLLMAFMGLSSCSSMTKGVVQAFIGGEEEDTRQCWIRGRPFNGLEAMFPLEGPVEETASTKPPLKILKVHGVGTHQPGYSARLVENLMGALDLHTVSDTTKVIELAHPLYPDGLGVLQVHRFIDMEDNREMIFYELTWDPIVEAEKQTLDFDNSKQVSDKRAGFNHELKAFVNDTVPDALMYGGKYRLQIQTSVSQALCWMMSQEWVDLPDAGKVNCDVKREYFWSQSEHDIAIISHSLGSRITLDALQTIGINLSENEAFEGVSEKLKQTNISLYMLSNQLPLTQLGQDAPEVAGEINAICDESSPRYGERFYEKIQLVAFSDPNDILSYTLQPSYVNQFIDSRLCPSVTNVVINIADVAGIFGKEFANPMKAHIDYEIDGRVMDLLVGGFSEEYARPEARERCEFIEVVSDKDIDF